MRVPGCRDPAEERKRTRDRVGKSAVEPYRPLRNMQPWAARALDGAAAAILNQSARSQQCASVLAAPARLIVIWACVSGHRCMHDCGLADGGCAISKCGCVRML